jgi:hypothetical protein
VNQTICAVWNVDKSRFLTLCYRLAALDADYNWA